MKGFYAYGFADKKTGREGLFFWRVCGAGIGCAGVVNVNSGFQFHKPSRGGFWSLIATQFQGAFSDNALKNLVIFLILGMSFPHEMRNRLISLVGIIFAIPFLLFSLAGGYFADRYSKRSVTIWTKYLEIAVMILALVGLGVHEFAAAIRGDISGVHAGGAVRRFQIRPACRNFCRSRNFRGATAFWSWERSWQSLTGTMARRVSGGHFPRTASVVRNCAAGDFAGGTCDELYDFTRARGGSGEEYSCGIR